MLNHIGAANDVLWLGQGRIFLSHCLLLCNFHFYNVSFVFYLQDVHTGIKIIEDCNPIGWAGGWFPGLSIPVEVTTADRSACFCTWHQQQIEADRQIIYTAGPARLSRDLPWLLPLRSSRSCLRFQLLNCLPNFRRVP